MSMTVPSILLQSPFWRTPRVHTLSAFATGQPMSGTMLDIILEEARRLATKTKGYAEQAPHEREDAVKHRRELAKAAAKLFGQIAGVVAAQKRAAEEKDKARKVQEKEQETAQEKAREERERREKKQKVDEELARKLKEAEEWARKAMEPRIQEYKQLRGRGRKRDLSWLAHPEDTPRTGRASASLATGSGRSADKSDWYGQFWQEKERKGPECRERHAKKQRDQQERNGLVTSMGKGRRITTTKTVSGPLERRSKIVLTPAKTTSATRSTPPLIAAAKAASASKQQAELPWINTPVASISQAEAGPAASDLRFDRARPHDTLKHSDPNTGAGTASTSAPNTASMDRTSDPLPTSKPADTTPSTSITSATDFEDEIVKAEEMFMEHIESLQESAIALAIVHDDMRRAIGRVEAKRKAERAERDRKAGELGHSVGKLEGRIGSLEFKDYYCADEWQWNHKLALLRVKFEKAKERTEGNAREVTILQVLAGDKAPDLERKSETQDERAKAYGSVVAQFAMRTDTLEAGLKDIMATLEKRGMALPQDTSAKRQRTA